MTQFLMDARRTLHNKAVIPHRRRTAMTRANADNSFGGGPLGRTAAPSHIALTRHSALRAAPPGRPARARPCKRV